MPEPDACLETEGTRSSQACMTNLLTFLMLLGNRGLALAINEVSGHKRHAVESI